MDWVSAAEAYIGQHGWGAQGKSLGVSRMYNDNDKTMLRKEHVVASQRPRGVLSGFLAVIPNIGFGVYLPPIAARMGPQRIRMRLSPEVHKDGMILSAYFLPYRRANHGEPPTLKTMVLEDVLVWGGKPVWNTMTFKDRWTKVMADFVTNHFVAMDVLQGVHIEMANYTSIAQLTSDVLDTQKVVELIPNTANTKRIIWIPPTEVPNSDKAEKTEALPVRPPTSGTKERLIAKRDMGPDVFSISRVKGSLDPKEGEEKERLGLALVRTLAISKALRLASADPSAEIDVSAVYNKQFDKWEILAVEPKKSDG